jgi:ABC-type antimicrobial peptide transport system permease subunit
MLFYPADRGELRSATVVLRTSGDPQASIPAVRRVVRAIDPDQPISSLETGRQALGETVADPRLLYVVMVALALVALTLGVVGVYGLVSFMVEQGRREIGIRMALGARARSVAIGVLRSGLTLGAVGVTIGLVATAAAGRFVAALLFGTAPLDAGALVTAAAVLMLACAAALVRPALQAAATDPARMLRSE